MTQTASLTRDAETALPRPSAGKAISDLAFSRAGKTLLGCALLSIAGWTLLKPFVVLGSTNAIVNARVVTVRAPIDGNVVANSDLLPGKRIGAGEMLGEVRNSLAENFVLQSTAARMRETEAEIASLTPLVTTLRDFGAQLQHGSAAYRDGRLKSLQALKAQSEATLAADQAQAAQAEQSARRAERGRNEGLISEQTLEDAKRDAVVAEQRAAASQQGAAAVQLQSDAAERGVTIDLNGIGSDKPYSKQRSDEVALEVMRLEQRIEEQKHLRDVLAIESAEAREEYSKHALASLSSAHHGRVQQVWFSPFEYVLRGTPLLSIVDCDSVFVEATTSQRVYDRLKVGMRASFRERASGVDYQGKILQLVGAGDQTPAEAKDAQKGFAASLPKEADGNEKLTVLIGIEGLAHARGEECVVGQSGEVTFHP